MKKLFISVPMKGRTEDNIKKSMEKMHKIAEIIFDTELEVIDSYVDEKSPKGANPPIFYLGKSIEKIAEADYFIGIPYSDVFNGCEIETNVARRYKICSVEIEFWRELMPDVLEIEEKYWNNLKEENE